jgi:phage gp36-like protein
MPYAAQSDLLQVMTLAELIQLTDDEKTGKVNAATVTDALTKASGKVEAYCRERYETPLQPNDTIVEITRDIAVYTLFGRRPGKMRDEVRQRYEDAVGVLKDISTGKASFDQPVGSTPQATSAGGVRPRRDGLRMTEKDLEGFV